jgi:DnaJ-domain-containing protein 1
MELSETMLACFWVLEFGCRFGWCVMEGIFASLGLDLPNKVASFPASFHATRVKVGVLLTAAFVAVVLFDDDCPPDTSTCQVLQSLRYLKTEDVLDLYWEPEVCLTVVFFLGAFLDLSWYSAIYLTARMSHTAELVNSSSWREDWQRVSLALGFELVGLALIFHLTHRPHRPPTAPLSSSPPVPETVHRMDMTHRPPTPASPLASRRRFGLLAFSAVALVAIVALTHEQRSLWQGGGAETSPDEEEQSSRGEGGAVLELPGPKNYYQILGVPKNASLKKIKAAYRDRARHWHPDKVVNERKKEAEALFHDLNEAYEVLSDKERRRKYDSGEQELYR